MAADLDLVRRNVMQTVALLRVQCRHTVMVKVQRSDKASEPVLHVSTKSSKSSDQSKKKMCVYVAVDVVSAGGVNELTSHGDQRRR